MSALNRSWRTVVVAVGIAGCATMLAEEARDTERWLAAAGFERKTADTPEKLAKLQAVPARTFVMRARDGASEYLYADPAGCHDNDHDCSTAS